MKNLKLNTLLIIMALIFTSCNEKPTEVNSSIYGENEIEGEFEFKSLDSDKFEISVGGSTQISAKVIGTGISYKWNASAGDIIGAGSKVVYTAAFCCVGNNVIKCVVSDREGNTETKEIVINVR